MLVGHPPFSGSTGELVLAHSQKIPPTANLVKPTVPVELGDVVATMLAKQPGRRQQAPSDVAKQLKPFLKRKSETSSDSLATSVEPETKVPIAARQDTSVEIKNPQKEIPKAIPISKLDSPMRSIPVPAAVSILAESVQESQLEPFPKSQPTKTLGWQVAAGILILFLMASITLGVVLTIRTPNGTIVIENLPEDAEVLVDGSKVDIVWNDGTANIEVEAGTRSVSVVKDGIEVSGQTVTVGSNRESQIIVTRQFDTAGEVSSDKVAETANAEASLDEEKSLLGVNLIRNGSCELPIVGGGVPYWSVDEGGWWARKDDPPPYDGASYFSATKCDFAKLSQEIDISELCDQVDGSEIIYSFSGVVRTWRNQRSDTSEGFVEFLNKDKEKIGDRVSTGASSYNSWTEFELGSKVPEGTRFINVSIESDRFSGTGNDGYFDSLEFTLNIVEGRGLAKNLLRNGGGEETSTEGSIPGWTIEQGSWRSLSMSDDWNTASIETPQGEWVLSPGPVRKAVLSQTVPLTVYGALIDNDTIVLDFRGKVCIYPHSNNDALRVQLTFLDADEEEIESAFDSGQIEPKRHWKNISEQLSVPKGTRYAKVTLTGIRLGGVHNNAFFDEFSVTCVQKR